MRLISPSVRGDCLVASLKCGPLLWERSLSIHENHHGDNRVAAYPSHDAAGQQLVASGFNLEFIADFARRRFWLILLSVLFMSGVGFAYFVAVPANYSATATLQMDPRKFQLFQQPGNLGDQGIANAPMESQLEALKSENLALKVIDDLHLADDPEFGKAEAVPIISNLIEKAAAVPIISNFIKTHGSQPESWRTRNALRVFDKRYTVKQRGVYLIDINFDSENPERAAQIANAIAQGYITGQIDAEYEVTRQGSKWLEGRIKELRDQVAAAQKAVNDYKAQNQIVDTGNGRLLNDQQLADLNTQLATARAKTSDTRARLDRISAALDEPGGTGFVNVAAGDGAGNLLIANLRTQYLNLAAREAEWSEKYGPSHLAVVNVRNSMRGIRASILEELQRIRESYKGDYDSASEAQQLIETQLSQAIAQSQVSNEAQVVLRNLETTAQNYKTLYDNFLKRYTEAIEQQSFPYTEARLLTKATPPIKRSYQKSLLIVAMTPFAGLFFGIALGALRDFLDRGFRTSGQIEALLGLRCLALIPLQKKPKKKAKGQPAPISGDPRTRLISNEPGVASSVVEQPFSRFAEAIRTIKFAADLHGAATTNKVIGITSAVPNEGKSTIAAALARSIAQFGGRVILVDCDLRNPSLSRDLAPSASAGILEAHYEKISLDEAVWKEPSQNLVFLPVFSGAPIAHSSEILASSAMKKFFEKLRCTYDYVVVDLPPLAPLVDVRGTTHLVDSYLLIVDWGRTYTAVVQHALSRAPGVYEKILGVALNKVDMKELSLYDGNRARYYHNKTYARYGYTD
jgi:polysaccharide biosynthesis transport protein